MGCGQSKIGIIYSKNKKNKNNNTKKGDSLRTASIDHKNGSTKSNKTNNNGVEVNRNEEQSGGIDNKNLTKKKATGPGNGPLLQQAEVSSSQVDFFKMLDEKIENGPDYDESVDATVRAEHVTDLLKRWELASMTWPSVNDLNQTNNTQKQTQMNKNPLDHHHHHQQLHQQQPQYHQNHQLQQRTTQLTAKDREGMRNIIGGRHEIAPVFTRNANRVDGLHDVVNCQSNMPRHVLESITQSPTQSLRKTSTSVIPPSAAPMTLAGPSSPTSRQFNNDLIGDINARIDKLHGNKFNYKLRCDFVGGDDDVDDVGDDNQLLHQQQQQKKIYCEEYLQQSGIISVQPQYHLQNNQINHHNNVNNHNYNQSGGVLRNSSSAYVQHYQLTNQQNYQQPKKRNFNAVPMT